MIRKSILSLLVVLLSGSAAAQLAPTVAWQNTFGGAENDYARCLIQTEDGGYVFAGYSYSHDGDVRRNHGSQDAWIVKLDSFGAIEWERNFGGSETDQANSIIQTSDGGFIFAGWTSSKDGDISSNHGSKDAWIVKLTLSGKIEWQRCYGGSGWDEANSIIQTAEGGYAFVGITASNDGDVKANHGGVYDGWFVKIDSIGTIEWQKTYGGTLSDVFRSVVQTPEYGFVIAGSTTSNDMDVTGNHGSFDGWLVKISESGMLQWQRCVGGSREDDFYCLIKTLDGGYAATGGAESKNGDVIDNHGREDAWLVKFTDSGKVEWQKCFGGSETDGSASIVQTLDSGFVLAGYVCSDNGQVIGNHGGVFDAWILKTSSTGMLQWQKCLGGKSLDDANSIIKLHDGSLVFAGSTTSIDGDVTKNRGMNDAWILKLIGGKP